MGIAINLLIWEATHLVALPGAEVTSFRGGKATLLGGRPPKGASNGKVSVTVDGLHQAEYYPSVFGLKWVSDDELYELLVADGADPDVADEIIAEAINLLCKKPY